MFSPSDRRPQDGAESNTCGLRFKCLGRCFRRSAACPTERPSRNAV